MTSAYPHNEQTAAQQMREATTALRKLFPAMFMFINKDKGAQASVEAGEATRRTLASAMATRTLAASLDFHASVDDSADINMRNKKNG